MDAWAAGAYTGAGADVAELADALDLGSSASRRAGSTPAVRTKVWRTKRQVRARRLRAAKGAKMAVVEIAEATVFAVH